MAVKRIVKRQGQLNNALVDNQLDYPIDSNLKNYVNVWFHLVTVFFI